VANFVPTTTGRDAFGKFQVPQAQIDAFFAARGTRAQVAAMQANPEPRRLFLSKSTFEAEAQQPIKAWLAGDTGARAAEAAVRSGVDPGDARMAAKFEEQVRFINSGARRGSKRNGSETGSAGCLRRRGARTRRRCGR